MRPLFAMILALSLTALACSAAPTLGAPTTAPGSIETAVAATLTALAPTVLVPTETTATPEGPTAVVEAPTAVVEATATLAPEGPPAATCSVVYAEGANLFCLGADGAPAVLTTAPAGQSIWQPSLSPDGQRVAYQMGVLYDNSALWVVGAAARAGTPGDPVAAPRLLVDAATVPAADPANVNSPRSYAWRPGTHTLIFDTRYVPIGGIQGPGEYINLDLHAVNADTGAVQPLLAAGTGGNFFISPNGQFIGISRGVGLDLINADGANYRPGLVTFPSILTYSEYQLKPALFWSADSLFFSVAIPSADPLGPDPYAAVYRVGADGVVQALLNVPGNFVFGGLIRPMFSFDGQYLVYSLLQPGSSQTEDVHLVRLAGADTTNTLVDARDVLSGWGFAPDSQHFAFTSTPGGTPGSGYALALDGTLQPWSPGLSSLADLQWQDAATVVYLGQINAAGWSLYRQTLGAEPVLLASGLSQQSGIDVLGTP